METVAEWALRFLDQHALLALFLWLLLEEGGVPMPVPGDLVVLAAGVRLGQGQIAWPLAILAVEVATLLGSTILFVLARWGGRPLLYRFGRYLRLDAARLAHLEEVLQRHGIRAVVLGRLTPGLRVTTTVAAGAFGVPYRHFVPGALIGSNNLPLLLLGSWGGPRLLQAVEEFSFSVYLAAVLAGLAAMFAAYVVLRRRAHLEVAAPNLSVPLRVETALAAGGFAIAVTVAALNLALYLFALFDPASPGELLLRLGRATVRQLGINSLTGVIIGGVVGYLVLHLWWALLYAALERHLPHPDWRGGLIFGILPLTVSSFVLFPLLGMGVAGIGLGWGLLPLAGEIVRLLVFCFSLSTAYTLLTRARAHRYRGFVHLTEPAPATATPTSA